jgi:hypothetical protein
MISFSISFWDLIKSPYFVATTDRRDSGWRQGYFKDNSNKIENLVVECKDLCIVCW